MNEKQPSFEEAMVQGLKKLEMKEKEKSPPLQDMTLRDLVAIQAMNRSSSTLVGDVAAYAYRQADAMLAERKKETK